MFWGLNLFSIFIILDTSIDLLTFFNKLVYKSNIIVPGIVLAIIGVISYFRFYHKSKYDKIINEIESGNSSIAIFLSLTDLINPSST